MNGALEDFSLLVTLKCPEDLRQRLRYHPQLNPEQSKLAEVLAPYHFDNPYPCGLSSCRIPHQHGYLVITADGKETNIGGHCGRKFFGEDFTIKANLQVQRARLKHQLDVLLGARARKAELLSRIAELFNRECGVKWGESTLRDFKNAVGQGVYAALREKARRNDSAIEITRVATAEERERHQVVNPSARPLQFVSEKVGVLNGLDFLNYDPQRELTQLKDKIYELEGLDLHALTHPSRREWVEWVGNIERVFGSVEECVADAIRFFCQANFTVVAALGKDGQEQARLAQVRWSTAERRVIVKHPK